MGARRGVLAVLAGVVLGAVGAPAVASASSEVGHDVSYPQCGQELPADSSFGIVGVNGGLATTVNPCLADQLAWAAGLPGAPGLQVYVNTANPGQLDPLPATWPSSGESPYGECTGDAGPACSWVYGRTRASVDVHGFLLPAAARAGVHADPSDVLWWLDVETMNTWQTGSAEARANNRAALEGMVGYLTGNGARVGLYSTGVQWDEIVGAVPTTSPLHALDSWLAGAQDPIGAAELCGLPPLTGGGDVVLAQFVLEVDDVPLDHDLPC